MAENILHIAGTRLRINGSGNLRMRFIGLDDVQTSELLPLVMSTSPGREPLRLANFKNQRARLKLYTTEIDEVMNVNRIVIFVKELWTDYPG